MKNSLTASLFKGTILNSPTRLNKLARATGWMKRIPKKVSPIDFVHGILHSVCLGGFSFRALATSIGIRLDPADATPECEVIFDTVSKNVIWKRTNQSAVDFMKGILGEVLKDRKIAKQNIPNLPGIKRILVQDSTKIGLPSELAEQFPGGKGSNGESAGLRLQGMVDLITGEAIRLELTQYHHQDSVAGLEIIPLLQPDDLVLQDLGYWNHSQLDRIAQHGSYYVSRYRSDSTVYFVGDEDQCGNKIDLSSYLSKHAPNCGDSVDINIVLGSSQTTQTRCRLVAVRVPDQIVEKRLRRINEDAKRRGKTPSARRKKLAPWSIYVTNLPADSVDTATVLDLYPLRWRIETIFKALKSYTPVEAISEHRSNPQHLQLLLYGWLCLTAVATQTGTFAVIKPKDKNGAKMAPNLLSLLKVIPKVFDLFRVALSHAYGSRLGDLIRRWMVQIEYHDKYENRRTRTNMAELTAAALGYDTP